MSLKAITITTLQWSLHIKINSPAFTAFWQMQIQMWNETKQLFLSPIHVSIPYQWVGVALKMFADDKQCDRNRQYHWSVGDALFLIYSAMLTFLSNFILFICSHSLCPVHSQPSFMPPLFGCFMSTDLLN